MARSTVEHLKRLAKLILKIDEKQKICDDLRKKAEPLVKARLVVVGGEMLQIDRLDELWKNAKQQLSLLKNTVQRDDVFREIEDLEAHLSNPNWELVETISNGLDQKIQLQDDFIRDYEGKRTKWEIIRDDIEKALDEARKVRAAVGDYKTQRNARNFAALKLKHKSAANG